MESRRATKEELARRRHNLSVIEEVISKDENPDSKLIEVRDFLIRRIKQIESDLGQEPLAATA